MAGLPLGTLIRRLLVAVVIVAAGVWILFFDTYSIRSHRMWKSERDRLKVENAELRQEIARLRDELSQPPTDESIEKVAREEYGMRRPDDVVYRVEYPNGDE